MRLEADRRGQNRRRSASQGSIARDPSPPVDSRRRGRPDPDSDNNRPDSESTHRRRQSFSEGRSDSRLDDALGRKLTDDLLTHDITAVQDQIGGDFSTKDVLEKLARDFEVGLAPNDSEEAMLVRLKSDRVINQDDYDFIQKSVDRLKTVRKIPDTLLQEHINGAKSQPVDQEFSTKGILNQLAQDFEVGIDPNDTEGEILNKLFHARVINRSDYDFIKANLDENITGIRAEALQRANQAAAETVAQRVRELEAGAESEKADLRVAVEAEAFKSLSRTHKRGLKQPPNSDKYKTAKVALDQKITDLLAPGIERIRRDLTANIERVRTLGLEAERQKQIDAHSDFLKNTNSHPFSFNALAVGGHFDEAARLVELVRRKPNMQALATPENYNLLIGARRVLGDDTTSSILDRVSPATLNQFNTLGDDGLVLLRELHQREGISDGKLTQMGGRIQEIQPLVGDISAKRGLAALLVNDTVEDIISLTQALEKFDPNRRISTLQTLRPHAVDAAALRSGLELANRLQWPADQIENDLTAVPLNSNATTVKTRIVGQALAVFDKKKQFHNWINTVDLLRSEAGHTVNVGDSFTLPHGNTRERIAYIRDGTNQLVGQFVIHYHPGASGASVDSPYGSNKHIKPERGNAQTARLYWESIPDSLKTQLPASY